MVTRKTLKRLESLARGELIEIPQHGGGTKRFTQQDMEDAFVNMVERAGAGEDAPPEHPVLAAVRNSSDPDWLNGFYHVEDPEAHTEPVRDLSESSQPPQRL
jgi:hypothetical protein